MRVFLGWVTVLNDDAFAAPSLYSFVVVKESEDLILVGTQEARVLIVHLSDVLFLVDYAVDSLLEGHQIFIGESCPYGLCQAQ